MVCMKCSLPVDRKNDHYAICEGKCAKRYHAACVGLSDATVCALFAKNVIWMCDACYLDFCNMRDGDDAETPDTVIDGSSSAVENDIADLKTKVAEIIETLSTITADRNQQQQQPRLMRHSTPISSPDRSSPLLNGTKTCHNNNDHTKAMNSGGCCAQDVGSEKFCLFLTNIESHTTEDDIGRLVCDSLNIVNNEKVNIRKLVPKGRTCDDLDYVSFKVSIDSELKASALQPSTWPIGLKYREFESRQVTWKSYS